MVTNGTVQTGAIFLLLVMECVILVALRPFSNSFVQWVETVLVSTPRALASLDARLV